MSTKDFVEKDYYKVLGVPKDATEAEIKKAYRKLAREFHPDANKGDAKAEERFKEISEANDILGDPKKRKEYDEARALFGNGGFRPGARRGRRLASTSTWATSSEAAPRAAAGGRRGRLRRRPRRRLRRPVQPRRRRHHAYPAAARPGHRVRGDAQLHRGGRRGHGPAADVLARRPCKACSGTGDKNGTPAGVPDLRRHRPGRAGRRRRLLAHRPVRGLQGPRPDRRRTPARSARAAGAPSRSRTMQVRIPAGVTDGQRIRLRGKGAPGRARRSGRRPVRRRARRRRTRSSAARATTSRSPCPSPSRRRRSAARSRCPTLGGPPVTLKLPPGTPNGRTMRARGKGAVRKDGTRGDLLVTVEVAVPKDLSATRRVTRWRRTARRPRARTRGRSCSRPRREHEMDGRPYAAAIRYELTEETPVYVISVAAQLSGLHPQTLRQYDRLGLVSPDRTAGPRPALLGPRHRTAAHGAAVVAGRGHQPGRHQAHHRTGEPGRRAPVSGSPSSQRRVDGAAAAMQQREAAGARLLPARPGAVPGRAADERAGGLAAQAAE